ncbi:MAG: hypothetical protein B5M53_05270 [Candidatus Cloacimonas sp. 4484_209]|nr:MAG: hypothetical protein B5M53_05270 [Candidatus Cloacimonas sp. 4484_209]
MSIEDAVTPIYSPISPDLLASITGFPIFTGWLGVKDISAEPAVGSEDTVVTLSFVDQVLPPSVEIVK